MLDDIRLKKDAGAGAKEAFLKVYLQRMEQLNTAAEDEEAAINQKCAHLLILFGK